MHSIKSSISISILHVAFGTTTFGQTFQSDHLHICHHTNHPQPVDIKTISIRIEDPEMIHLLGG